MRDEPRRPSPKVRGDQMSGDEQWSWAMRALLLAASPSELSAYDADCAAFAAVGALLDGLDEEAVRGVAAHLALAPRRIRSAAFDLDALRWMRYRELHRGIT